MTGEPLPVLKREGISVYAGTVIEEGSIVVTVRQLASNTKISRIIELIGNSEELKAGVQSRAETLADRIVPFSFIGFFATLIFTKTSQGQFHFLWLTTPVQSSCQHLLP